MDETAKFEIFVAFIVCQCCLELKSLAQQLTFHISRETKMDQRGRADELQPAMDVVRPEIEQLSADDRVLQSPGHARPLCRAGEEPPLLLTQFEVAGFADVQHEERTCAASADVIGDSHSPRKIIGGKVA